MVAKARYDDYDLEIALNSLESAFQSLVSAHAAVRSMGRQDLADRVSTMVQEAKWVKERIPNPVCANRQSHEVTDWYLTN